MAAPPAASFEALFKPVLGRGNPIRAIGEAADRVSAAENVPVIRLHLGNPSTAQFAETKDAMLKSMASRVSGYGPHPGSPAEREQLAAFFNDAEGVPGHFSGEDAVFFPGATCITKALFHIFDTQSAGKSAVLLSRPGYPVYENQALADGFEVRHYSLDPASGVLSFSGIDAEIAAAAAASVSVRAVVITYPHNPTGKALTEAEAVEVAQQINSINEKHPNILFYNDGVYSATSATSVGYNSFYPHLSEAARLRTVTGVSGAKLASLGGERVGGVATKSPLLRSLLQNAQSQITAGVSVHSIPAFLATTLLFRDQWKAGAGVGGPRASIADFYQQRIAIVASGLGPAVVPRAPGGGMYVYANFTNQLKGKPVPEALRQAVGSATVETGAHLRDLLLAAHKLGGGYLPVATVNGEVFSEAYGVIALRISCVERSLRALELAVVTFQAVLSIVGGVGDCPPPVDFAQARAEMERD